jgi:hypothetical protein
MGNKNTCRLTASYGPTLMRWSDGDYGRETRACEQLICSDFRKPSRTGGPVNCDSEVRPLIEGTREWNY